MRQACKRLPGLPARSDSSLLSFKMCFALTARYDKQGFIHPHNQHIVLDSLALAGLQHGFEASEHQGHPYNPPK